MAIPRGVLPVTSNRRGFMEDSDHGGLHPKGSDGAKAIIEQVQDYWKKPRTNIPWSIKLDSTGRPRTSDRSDSASPSSDVPAS